MHDVIILASGIGSRCGLDYPKQFYKINNQTMLSYVIDKFIGLKNIGKIIVTMIPDNQKLFKDEIEKYKNVEFINGGQTRQDTVRKALKYVENDRVIIHESVRPLITKSYIELLMSYNNDCIVPYVTINNTVFSNDLQEYLNREELYSIQLPQVFNTEKLKCAHVMANINQNQYTDDSSLYYTELNEHITFVKGLEENIKITNRIDLELLKNLE